MTMMEAVKSVFSQYVGFNGRARRAEYWKWFLFTIIVSIVINVIGAIFTVVLKDSSAKDGISAVLDFVWGIATFLPALALDFRRLHDIGKSGWWLLLILIPIVGGIILLVWNCKDSQPGENQYGPNPKGM